MWKKERCLFACLVILVALSITGCMGSGMSSSKTYTISGTLTNYSVPDDVYGYVKLVAPGGAGEDAALSWAKSGPFLSGVASYSITNIPAGSYTGYAFIDADGDAAGDGTSMPDNDDWATDGGQDLTLDSDQVIDLPDDAWIYLGPTEA
jgi:hypothetical protein